MKSLTKYISHMKDLHSLNEKLIINKDFKYAYTYTPKSFEELKKIIEDKYNKLGPGTEQEPIDLNNIDVSNIETFYGGEVIKRGIFQRTKFQYIDISDWNVSRIKDMSYMFYDCTNLKSVGDLSEWNVSNVEYMKDMFFKCEKLISVGDLSNWKTPKLSDISEMFYLCYKLESVGNLSRWDISNLKKMYYAFGSSRITDLPSWYEE